jgi:mRNA-degrading endonuclease toxin of MazEF toxin-antitoxin module
MALQPERGDVVRSIDPFKLGTDRQRPWLVVNTEQHPFAYEQWIAVAISTTRYPDSIPLTDDVWNVGGVPRESFASPWAVHSPRVEDIAAWQGRVTDETVEAVLDRLDTYLR